MSIQIYIIFVNQLNIMEIKGSTNIVGLIGHPVEHSFSPPMHNAAFDKLGMDYAYVAFDVNPNNLKMSIQIYIIFVNQLIII